MLKYTFTINYVELMDSNVTPIVVVSIFLCFQVKAFGNFYLSKVRMMYKIITIHRNQVREFF